MNTNKLCILCLLLLLSSFSLAQNTNLTATITDPSGQVWFFGTWQADFLRNPQQAGIPPQNNGHPIQEHGYTGALSVTGQMVVTLPDVQLTTPSGGQWEFTLCPNASSACNVVDTGNRVTGASVDLSAFLSAGVQNPKVYSDPTLRRAYKDSEVVPANGAFYYDVTLNCLKFWNTSNFACISAGNALPNASGAGQVPVSTGPGTVYTAQTKPSTDVRDLGVDCTGVTPADTALGTATNNSWLIPANCIVSTTANHTYSADIEFKLGGMLKPATSTVLTLTGTMIAGRQQIFTNALPAQGIIDFTGNTGISKVFPEWWGGIPGVANATTMTSAIQSAEFGAFGRQNRINGSGLVQWNKILSFCGNYTINGTVQFYHVINFVIEGCGKNGTTITQTGVGQRIIDGQNIAYGTVHDMQFYYSGGSNPGPAGVLIDIDNDHTHGADLSPQEITFQDIYVFGSFVTDVGILISKHGGDAQGDNIRCINCILVGFTGAGWQVGGNNTARNAGRFYATNAIKQQIIGGDAQNNPLYGVAVYGGSIEVNGMSMENEAGNFGSQTGADLYCEGPQDPCIMRGVRSEGHLLTGGGPMWIENSRTLFQVGLWYGTGFNLPGTVVSTGTLFSGTGLGGDGKYYKVTTGGTFGGLTQTVATSGTLSSITNSGAAWTVNGFTGQQVTIWSGTGQGEICAIASNTATTITCTANFSSRFYQLPIVAPDATSQFVVEPNWGSNPTTSGTVTFALFDFQGISGCNMSCVIKNVEIAGGTVNVTGPGIGGSIDGLKVSRSDWSTITTPNGASGPQNFWDWKNISVSVFAPNNIQTVNVGGITRYKPWAYIPFYFGNTVQPSYFPNSINIGTSPICWHQGNNQGNGYDNNDICMGIRTDWFAIQSATRTVLGYIGTLGPATAWGTNINGTSNRLQGGLGTGSGTPGDLLFSVGNTYASGSNVTEGADRWRISGSNGSLLANASNVDIGSSQGTVTATITQIFSNGSGWIQLTLSGTTGGSFFAPGAVTLSGLTTYPQFNGLVLNIIPGGNGTSNVRLADPLPNQNSGAFQAETGTITWTTKPRDAWIERNTDIGGNLTIHGTCSGCGNIIVLQQNFTTTQSSNTTIAASPSTSTLAWAAKTITMPNTGCPCRVHISWFQWGSTGASGQHIGWISDGTNTFATGVIGVTTGSASLYGGGSDAISPVTYANNASITFNLIETQDMGGTVNALASSGFGSTGQQNSWINHVVITGSN